MRARAIEIMQRRARNAPSCCSDKNLPRSPSVHNDGCSHGRTVSSRAASAAPAASFLPRSWRSEPRTRGEAFQPSAVHGTGQRSSLSFPGLPPPDESIYTTGQGASPFGLVQTTYVGESTVGIYPTRRGPPEEPMYASDFSPTEIDYVGTSADRVSNE
jgi:hypothetical protein